MAGIVIVLGCVGAGKTMHSKRFSQEYTYNDEPIYHVSVGEYLRAIRSGHEASKYSSFINDPHAPSPLPNRIINGVLFEHVDELKTGLAFIDGYPRHQSGVEAFLRSFACWASCTFRWDMSRR
jgi:adenylate kinase family enzyme